MYSKRGLKRLAPKAILGIALGAGVLTAGLLQGTSGTRPRQAAPDPAVAAMRGAQAPRPGTRIPLAATRVERRAPAVLRKGRSFHGDVRRLPRAPGLQLARGPEEAGAERQTRRSPAVLTFDAAVQSAVATAQAPPPSASFAGLDCLNVTHESNGGCAHWPPDTDGEAGPEYYVQTVNTSVGIFSKTGTPLAAFRFADLWAGAGTGTPCDTYDSQARDPVVLYDSATDRWLLMDFSSSRDAQGGLTPPYFMCFAVSKTGDPVTGGWNFYTLLIADQIPDYAKFGIWPDGLYMTGNMFPIGGSFTNIRTWVVNKSEMEAGTPTHVQSFDLPRLVGNDLQVGAQPSTYHTITGIPPAGRENLLSVIGGVSPKRLVRIWKFHVDWTTPANTTLTGPTEVKAANWGEPPTRVPAKNGNDLWTIGHRAMQQAQYVNLGGVESLWLTHTVSGPSNSAVTAPRWTQINVTGGTIVTKAPLQESTWAPDSTLARWIPSLAVDKLNDMAIGYSVSSATMFPAIRYAGRLSSDASSTLGQTERSLVEGTASQCCRFFQGQGDPNWYWGDYAGMAIDPNGCDFFLTSEYYAAPQPTSIPTDNWQTRIGSFRLNPGCTPTKFATALTVSPAAGPPGGTVSLSATLRRATVNLSGKSVAFTLQGTSVGSAVTDANGVATLANVSLGSIGAGSYPTGVGASFAGDAAYNASTGSGSLTVG